MEEQLPLTPNPRRLMPPAGSEELLEAPRIAEWFGVTTAWIYAETRAGRIPHITFGRSYRYRRSTLERWLDEKEGT
ncbi:helix-turn-helix domain-containing protein [Paraconexibacter algicola]|uniref:Helix-turn-helix domain-containing protein n=1 Tax=Paraconexibacter algicola TaxID=2133960 RepID=A0A2T4UDR7_9ACTN|nr:helix-turn-helix domain-containing protein [Paraconexibacter algicola]PTL55572.1 hypothetical protein C7Y72_18170 [Paraconexibacter algicola]